MTIFSRGFALVPVRMSELQLQPSKLASFTPETSRETGGDPSPGLLFPPADGTDCVSGSRSECPALLRALPGPRHRTWLPLARDTWGP